MWWLSTYTIVLHPKKENFNIYDEVINLTVMQESQLLQTTCQHSEFVSICMKQSWTSQPSSLYQIFNIFSLTV